MENNLLDKIKELVGNPVNSKEDIKSQLNDYIKKLEDAQKQIDETNKKLEEQININKDYHAKIKEIEDLKTKDLHEFAKIIKQSEEENKKSEISPKEQEFIDGLVETDDYFVNE